MIYLVVLSALYALHLLLKLHWITTVVIGGFLLLRISRHRKWYKKKIVYERKFEEVSEYLDMLLYAFVKEEKVERALVNVDAAMVDGPMRGVLQKAIDHMHMTFDETDVMRDSLQMIEREYACSRIKNVHDFIVHVEIYGGAIERPVELLLADKKRWEQRICGSMKERRKMFVDIVMSIAASLLICGMILYLPVMEIDISKNMISQVLTIVVVILDDLIFTRAQKYLAIDWLALDGQTDEERETFIGSSGSCGCGRCSCCILFWASADDSGGTASGCSDGKSAPGRTGGCQKNAGTQYQVCISGMADGYCTAFAE